MTRVALVLALAVFLPSCGRPPQRTVETQNVPSLFSEPAPIGRDANDVGRFLAGLPGTPGSPFGALEQQEAWKAHSLELDQDWRKFEAEAIPAMSQFRSEELSRVTAGNPVVFYPFSGPDALMVRVFFADRPITVMVGLEPPGTLPAPDRLARKDLGPYLEDVRSTVYSELHRSFFITREMDRQFRGQVSDGLLPTILHLLVRTRHTITGFRYVRLDPEGRIVARVPGERAAGNSGRGNGVQIDLRTDADQSLHRIFYFSVNLSDDRLHANQPFWRFLSKLGGVTTYLKATSYMPHHQEFSTIRQQILSKSAVILQDDSGIPYRFFDPAEWRVQLYGAYDRPYGSFRWLEQPDLRNAYKTLTPKPLRFQIGYGFSRVPSNLQLAVRTRKDTLR